MQNWIKLMQNTQPDSNPKISFLLLSITVVVVVVLLIAGLMRLSQNFTDILGYVLTGLGLGGMVTIGGAIMEWIKTKK